MNLGKSEEAAPYLFRVYLAVFPRILSPCKYCIFTFIISQCNIPFSAPSPFYPSFINLGKTWVNNALVIPKRSENPKTRLPQVFRNLGKHRYLATSLGKTRASSAIQIRHIIKNLSHIFHATSLQSHFLPDKIKIHFRSATRFRNYKKSLAHYNSGFSSSQLSPKFFPSFDNIGKTWGLSQL